MGISRLRWGILLILAGACSSLLRHLPSAPNPSLAERQGESLGQGIVMAACYIGGIAFLIQHYRHRHDYDEEDEDRRE